VSSSVPTVFTPAGGYGDTSLSRYERELPAPTLGDDEALLLITICGLTLNGSNNRGTV